MSAASGLLIYTPGGRNGELLERRLTSAQVRCKRYDAEYAFLKALGPKADVLLLSERALSAGVVQALTTFRQGQPAWSSPPLLVLKQDGLPHPELPGSYILEKPLPFTTLLNVVHLALRTRARQHEVGRLIARLKRRKLDLEDEVAEQLASLEASELRFETSFRASPTPTALINRARGTFIDANASFQTLTGYAPETLRTRTPASLDLIERQAVKQLLETDTGTGFELRLRTKDGQRRYCLVSTEALTLGGQACLFVTFVDISERKQNEAYLLRAIEEVMRDASWFSRAVVEKVGQLKGEVVAREAPTYLTRREEQVLGLIGRGLANKDIAERLELSPNTVRNYIKNIYDKIGARSRAEAIIWARERGIDFVEG